VFSRNLVISTPTSVVHVAHAGVDYATGGLAQRDLPPEWHSLFSNAQQALLQSKQQQAAAVAAAAAAAAGAGGAAAASQVQASPTSSNRSSPSPYPPPGASPVMAGEEAQRATHAWGQHSSAMPSP